MGDEYILSAEQNDNIFKNNVIPDLLNDFSPTSQNSPKLVVLGGQAGAGKSNSKLASLNEMRSSGAVVIDVDAMRVFHPDFDKMNSINDKLTAVHTNHDAGIWAKKAIEYAIDNRYNVIVEETMKSPDRVNNTISKFIDKGYVVEVKTLVVKGLQSEMSLFLRYEQEKNVLGHGRLTPKDVHDSGYQGLPNSLHSIEDDKKVKSLQLDKRDGNTIYKNVVINGSWVKASKVVNTLNNERNKDWSDKEIQDHFKQFETIKNLMSDRGASKSEWKEINNVESRHKVSLKNNIERNKLRSAGLLPELVNGQYDEEAKIIYTNLNISDMQNKLNKLFNVTNRQQEVSKQIDQSLLKLGGSTDEKLKVKIHEKITEMIKRGIKVNEKMINQITKIEHKSLSKGKDQNIDNSH